MGGRCVVGSEHDPAGRGEPVVGGIVKVEPLAVADPVVDLESLLPSALPRGFDQGRSKVNAGDLRTRPGCQLGDRARSACQVEPGSSWLRMKTLDEERMDIGDCFGNVLVGTVTPHGGLSLLQFLESHDGLLCSHFRRTGAC